MKIRIARKVFNGCGKRSYRGSTIEAATKKLFREHKQFMDWFCQTLGPLGIAEIRYEVALEDACMKHGISIEGIHEAIRGN